jgi:hypothetical protein
MGNGLELLTADSGVADEKLQELMRIEPVS